ncbi:MAG TPA: hypothetical protein VGI43_08835 [Mucilaginibacter sp.]|jgi:hypothetical protein
MYIRFITQFVNEDGEAETGIFRALRHFRELSLTQDIDIKKLNALNNWFNGYLDEPTWFSNAGNKNAAAISLSWFKDTAKEHLLKVNELIEVLEKYDLIVERITTKNPGYVVYEDEYQVSAIPFKADRKKTL